MPQGPARPAPVLPAKTAPHGPVTANRKVSHPIPARTGAGLRPSPRNKRLKPESTAQANSTTVSRTGQTRMPAIHGIFHGKLGRSSFKSARDSLLQQIWSIFLCDPKLLSIPTLPSPSTGRQISQPFTPVGRFTHSPPVCFAPPPPRLAAPVTLPPTHHIWFSLTGPGPSVT